MATAMASSKLLLAAVNAKVAVLREMLAQAGIAQERLAFCELGALDRYILAGLVEQMSGQIARLLPVPEAALLPRNAMGAGWTR